MLSRRRFGVAALAAPFVGAVRAQATSLIRYAHFAPAEDPSVAALVALERAIAEKTGGRWRLQRVPLAQLPKPADAQQALASGGLDFYCDGVAGFTPFVESFAVLEAPGLWRDAAHLARGLASSDGLALGEELRKARSLRLIASIYTGMRQLTLADRDATQARDLAGLKLRVPPDAASMAMAKAWGATPVTVAIPELYAALQQRRVDGQEHPLWVVESLKLAEVQKFLVLSAHQIKPRFLVAAQAFWSALSESDRELLQSVTAASMAATNAALVREEAAALERLARAGMTILTPDRAAFADAVQAQLLPVFEGRWGQGRYQRLQAA
jgi:tripartite ATP-independent transporter DctP family solute receptor